MHLLSFCSVIDAVAWRGMFFTVFILQFVFACQLLLLQPLFAALDGKPGNAAGLFERVSQSIKVKHYSEALNDLNAAIEADPTLSEAYYHRGSVLRQLCRYEESEKNYRIFLDETWELSCRKGALSIASGTEHSGNSF